MGRNANDRLELEPAVKEVEVAMSDSFTAVFLKIQAFLDVTRCCWLNGRELSWCLYFHGQALKAWTEE